MSDRSPRRTRRATAVLLLTALLPACGGDAPPDELRVMTFNVRNSAAADGPQRWGLRKEAALAAIRAFDPDLLGTQELMVAQGVWLRERLPGYDFFGQVRAPISDPPGEQCGVFWRRDRFERVDGGHFWLSETPEEPGSVGWDAALPRIVTWVALREREGGGTLLFFNAHFDHEGAEARRRSAELLRARITALAGDDPVVVTGDFNVGVDSAAFAALTAAPPGGALRLHDAYRQARPEPGRDEGTFHGYDGVSGGPRIDWILVTEPWTGIEGRIDRQAYEGLWPSDHFPVRVVLRRGGRAPVDAPG